jgi:hypothetical protein
VRAAVGLLKNSLELVVDADAQLREILDYPLDSTLANDEKAQPLLEDNFAEVAIQINPKPYAGGRGNNPALQLRPLVLRAL